MDYESVFRKKFDGLRRDGRHRVFAELERHAGSFQRATHYREHTREVIVWCSNDYLGMGRIRKSWLDARGDQAVRYSKMQFNGRSDVADLFLSVPQRLSRSEIGSPLWHRSNPFPQP
jgi:7-keto-8-aminopelargonate synthetase-like enzyme